MTENDQRERTDRLEITLQAIESAQQTGVLTVERAKGGVRETGIIKFIYGQPVEATAGNRAGSDAFEWLSTWGSCRYVFTTQFPSEIVVSPIPAAPVLEDPPTSPFALITQFIQKSVQPVAEVVQSVGDALVESPSTPRVPPVTPAPVPQTRTALQAYIQSPVSQPAMPRITVASPPPAPHRLLDGIEALSYIQRIGLSRQHRHVFLLLDGRRTASDIVRLTNHPLREVQSLLSDLEQFGLIKRS